MSRSGRDHERGGDRTEVREPVNYVALAKQSPTIEDYKRRLAERGVTLETPKEWQKAMTAWQALEASSQGAPERGGATRMPATASKEADYGALAYQFRHRRDYERYLVRELGLKPETTPWEKASSAYDLKEVTTRRTPMGSVSLDAGNRGVLGGGIGEEIGR